MRQSYLHLDVFADEMFHGNQLAVFHDARGLDAQRMQYIAAEMAFPETSFVLPPEAPNTMARVRIFTPTRELPMAGHPTIGTTFALAATGALTPNTETVILGLGVGPTPVFLEWQEQRLNFAWMRQPLPIFGFLPEHLGRLAGAIGLSESDITDSGLRPQQVSSGVPFLFVPVATRQAVNRAVVDRVALQRCLADMGQPELPLFVFSLEPGGDDATVFSRMFAPLFGIPEDPATGGASGPLGAYLLHHGAVTREQAGRMVSLQGVAMGRPSRISISIRCSGESIREVLVGGTCVTLGAGYLDVTGASCGC